MSKAPRRMAARNARKPDDVFPGGHMPPQPEMATLLPKLMETLEACLPGTGLTLFVAQRIADTPGGLPRFSYISNSSREDMLSVLDAFTQKHRPVAKALDELDRAPSEGTAQ